MYPEFYELDKKEQEKLQGIASDGDASDQDPRELYRLRLQQKTEEWLQRPARRQMEDTTTKNAAYVEGNYDYNIWYDTYLTDV